VRPKPLPNITFHQVEVNQYAVFQYAPYDITLSTKIAEVINEYDLDLLHMHYAVPHAVCGILAKHMSGKDIKIMTTLHGTDITVLGYDHSLKNAIKGFLILKGIFDVIKWISCPLSANLIPNSVAIIPEPPIEG